MRKSLALSTGLLATSSAISAQDTQHTRHQELKNILSRTEYQEPGQALPIAGQLELMDTLLSQHTQEYFIQIQKRIDKIVQNRKKIGHKKDRRDNEQTTQPDIIRDTGFITPRVYDAELEQYVSLSVDVAPAARSSAKGGAICIKLCDDPRTRSSYQKMFFTFDDPDTSRSSSSGHSVTYYDTSDWESFYNKMQRLDAIVARQESVIKL